MCSIDKMKLEDVFGAQFFRFQVKLVLEEVDVIQLILELFHFLELCLVKDVL